MYAFCGCDGAADFLDQCRDTSGTTAVCILIEHSSHRLWVANVGDSRVVLCRKGGLVVPLTRDHKADRPDEVERIRKAGGKQQHTHNQQHHTTNEQHEQQPHKTANRRTQADPIAAADTMVVSHCRCMYVATLLE